LPGSQGKTEQPEDQRGGHADCNAPNHCISLARDFAATRMSPMIGTPLLSIDCSSPLNELSRKGRGGPIEPWYQSVRKYGRYHRPIARLILFWPNGDYARGKMTKTTGFQTDIGRLFTERDIQCMSKAFNLGSYEDVKKHAGVIYDRIRGIGGAVMPAPPPRGETLGTISD